MPRHKPQGYPGRPAGWRPYKAGYRRVSEGLAFEKAMSKDRKLAKAVTEEQQTRYNVGLPYERFATGEEVKREGRLWTTYQPSKRVWNRADPMTCLTQLSQGPAANQRVGDRVDALRLRGKFCVAPRNITTLVGYPDAMRFLIVLDRSPNGVQPDLDSILVTPAAATCPWVYRPQSQATDHRFSILFDKVWCVPQAGFDYTGLTYVPGPFHLEPFDIKCAFRSFYSSSPDDTEDTWLNNHVFAYCCGMYAADDPDHLPYACDISYEFFFMG